MIRFILTVPDRMKSDVLEQMLRWRQTEGDTVTIRVITRPSVLADESAPTVAAEPQADRSLSDFATDLEATVPPTSARLRPGRSHTLYRVIDTATHMGPVPHMVRVYLLDHPNSTARDIQAGTGRGMKSVESAIYALRHKGIVRESERL